MKNWGRRGTAALALTMLSLAAAPAASASSLDPWWFDAMNVGAAHQQSTGKGVKIAVIDGAINMDAPELKGAKVTLRKGNSNLTDGLFDAKSYPRALYAGHGTAMTALIVGQGTGNAPGGAGITGIAPDAEVLFYQTDRDPTDRQTDNSSALFDQAIKDKVDIISYSFGGGAEMLEPQLKAAAEAGIVVVASAGAPDGGVLEPANQPGVVSVGAADKKGYAWSKQPEGKITIISPGVDIQSGIMRGAPDDARWVSGVARSGTSDATPLVAGALALVKSKYPEATGNQLIQQLIHSGGENWGVRPTSGFGLLRLDTMLARTPVGWPDENPLIKGADYTYKTYPPSVYEDPAAKPSGASQQDKDQTPAASSEENSSTSPLPWVAGGAVALLAVGGAVIAVRRRGQHGTDITSTGGRTHGTQ